MGFHTAYRSIKYALGCLLALLVFNVVQKDDGIAVNTEKQAIRPFVYQFRGIVYLAKPSGIGHLRGYCRIRPVPRQPPHGQTNRNSVIFFEITQVL